MLLHCVDFGLAGDVRSGIFEGIRAYSFDFGLAGDVRSGIFEGVRAYSFDFGLAGLFSRLCKNILQFAIHNCKSQKVYCYRTVETCNHNLQIVKLYLSIIVTGPRRRARLAFSPTARRKRALVMRTLATEAVVYMRSFTLLN